MTDDAVARPTARGRRAAWTLAAAFLVAACVGGGGGGSGGAAPGGGAVAQSPSGGGSTAASVAAAVNAERAANGLPALAANPNLAAAAQAHAADIAANGLMGHAGSDGSDIGERARRAGYGGSRITENVAVGHDSPSSVVTDWMNSPGHRANILDPAVTELGVGHATGAPLDNMPGRFWVLVFGNR